MVFSIPAAIVSSDLSWLYAEFSTGRPVWIGVMFDNFPGTRPPQSAT